MHKIFRIQKLTNVFVISLVSYGHRLQAQAPHLDFDIEQEVMVNLIEEIFPETQSCQTTQSIKVKQLTYGQTIGV